MVDMCSVTGCGMKRFRQVYVRYLADARWSALERKGRENKGAENCMNNGAVMDMYMGEGRNVVQNCRG